MTRRRRIRSALMVAAITLSVCPLSAGQAQTAAAAEVKAALLINFVKFTEWPAELAGTGPRTICVVGDDRIVKALVDAVRGQSAEGRSLTAVRMAPDADVRACHLVFVSDGALRTSRAVLDSIRPLPILTISDANRFAQSSGMVELFLEDDRMRFAVNLRAVERSNLRISSRLLSFAKLIKDHDVR